MNLTPYELVEIADRRMQAVKDACSYTLSSSSRIGAARMRKAIADAHKCLDAADEVFAEIEARAS